MVQAARAHYLPLTCWQLHASHSSSRDTVATSVVVAVARDELRGAVALVQWEAAAADEVHTDRLEVLEC